MWCGIRTDLLNGGGHDTIEDKQGTNAVLITGQALFNFTTIDGTNYLSMDGVFTGILKNGDINPSDIDQNTAGIQAQAGANDTRSASPWRSGERSDSVGGQYLA